MLFVHTVLTFTIGFCLLFAVGFLTACKWAQKTLLFYGNGLKQTTYKRLLEINGLNGVAEWETQRENSLNKNYGVTEHLVVVNNSGQPTFISSSQRKCEPSKRRQQSFCFLNREIFYNETKDNDNGI